MSTLTIKDLSHAETLDRQALSAVRGGMARMKTASSNFMPEGDYGFPKHDSSLKAEQLIGQNQEVFNANGNNVALVCGIESVVKPRQEASNSITRY